MVAKGYGTFVQRPYQDRERGLQHESSRDGGKAFRFRRVHSRSEEHQRQGQRHLDSERARCALPAGRPSQDRRRDEERLQSEMASAERRRRFRDSLLPSGEDGYGEHEMGARRGSFLHLRPRGPLDRGSRLSVPRARGEQARRILAAHWHGHDHSEGSVRQARQAWNTRCHRLGQGSRRLGMDAAQKGRWITDHGIHHREEASFRSVGESFGDRWN